METKFTDHYNTVNAYYLKNWDKICPGWNKIIGPLVEFCQRHNIQIHQIKEKFGALRFYTSSAPDVFYDMVRIAEWGSTLTCEICGEAGTNECINGWYATHCPEHRGKRG